MSSTSRKPTKRKANTLAPKRRARKRRQIRRGTSPSHMLMSPQEEAKFSTPQALTIPGRVQVDLLLRAGSAMYLKPREVQAGQAHVWVGQDYETTEYTSLDMLRSPFRSSVMDSWTPKEIALFEACICAWGKDFSCIAQHIRTKSTKEVVEFYYRVWKHSQHYYIWKAHKVQCEQLALLKEQHASQQQKGAISSPDSVHASSILHNQPINPMISLLAPNSASYAKRLSLLQHLLTRPNPNIPSNSPLYSLLPPDVAHQLTQHSMLKSSTGVFKTTPSQDQQTPSDSREVTERRLNQQQAQSELHDADQMLSALKRGWTRDTGALAQSVANPNMSAHHLQYHTSTNNPHNPTVTARDGSTSHNIYPSSNPYHLTSKPVRNEESSTNASMYPYDITTGATATSSDHINGVLGWSNTDNYSSYTIAHLTRDGTSHPPPHHHHHHHHHHHPHPHHQGGDSHGKSEQSPTTNTCEVCHSTFSSPLQLYQHVRLEHYLVFADRPKDTPNGTTSPTQAKTE